MRGDRGTARPAGDCCGISRHGKGAVVSAPGMAAERHKPMPARGHAASLGAKTRNGSPCRTWRVTGKSRCRMHGGARGSGAPKGSRNGSYKHGGFTCEAIEERRALREIVAEFRDMAKA